MRMTSRHLVSIAAVVRLVAATLTATITTAAAAPAWLRAGPHGAFSLRQVISYLDRLRYTTYDRTYRGLPVIGGSVVVVTDAAGQVLDLPSGQPAPISLPTITPTLTKATAESVAGAQLSIVDSVESARLAVYPVGEPRLASQTTVTGRRDGAPSRLAVVVDARTGAVLSTEEQVAHGTGTAAWNGPNPVPLDTTHSGSIFLMRDPTLVNLSCQISGGTVFGPDDQRGDGNPTHLETACVDALFAAKTEARMLRTWLGRNGFTGSGGGWPIAVVQNLIDDVFFDGSRLQIGHNLMGQFFTSLDLVGHELGHGVDMVSGGLSGGGTKEFIADAFGAATEWFANEPSPFDVSDFLIGEQVHFSDQPDPARNMAQPSLLGIPDCYTGNTDPFTAVGVGDHWFYLVAEGSAPTDGQPASPTCNHTAVSGVGVQTAMQVLYNAMLAKPAGSSYLTYRKGTLLAAKVMFPGNCQVFNTVKAAWDAVSVPTQAGEATCA
jgi:Zn-dependent metalloprotease